MACSSPPPAPTARCRAANTGSQQRKGEAIREDVRGAGPGNPVVVVPRTSGAWPLRACGTSTVRCTRRRSHSQGPPPRRRAWPLRAYGPPRAKCSGRGFASQRPHLPGGEASGRHLSRAAKDAPAIPWRAHLPGIAAQSRRPAGEVQWRPSCGPGEGPSMCVPQTLGALGLGSSRSLGTWRGAALPSGVPGFGNPGTPPTRGEAFFHLAGLSCSPARVCVLPCIYRGEEWSGCTGAGEALHRVLRPSSGQARMYQRASAVELNPEESMSTAWPR